MVGPPATIPSAVAAMLAIGCVAVPVTAGAAAGWVVDRLVHADGRRWMPATAAVTAAALVGAFVPFGALLAGVVGLVALLTRRRRTTLLDVGLPALATVLVATRLPLSSCVLVAATCSGTLPHAAASRGRRLLMSALVVLVPTAVAAALAPVLMQFGLWDMVCFGFLCGLGALLATGRIPLAREQWTLVVASTLLSLGTVEVAVRLWVDAPAFPPASSARLRIDSVDNGPDGGGTGAACDSLFGTPDQPRRRSGVPRIVHVGDSMVYGLFVAEAERFTDVLQRLEPNEQHVNAGRAGTGPDYYLVYLRKLLDAEPAEAAVMYVLLANDEQDLDRPYACCDEHALLTYADGGVSDRCRSSSHGSALGMHFAYLLRHSPPPYPLQVATGFAKTARLVAGSLVHTADTVSRESTNGTPREHMRMIFHAFADELARRKMSGAVVLLYSVRDQTESLETAAELVTLGRAAGLPVLDAGPVLRSHAVDGRVASLYTDDELHLNARGHAVIADWLHQALPAAFGAKSAVGDGRDVRRGVDE